MILEMKRHHMSKH